MAQDTHPVPGAEADHDDPTALTTVIVGFVSVVLVAVTIIGLEVLYYRTAEAEYERKVVAAQPDELRRVRAEQIEALATYRWVDQNEGIVAIPIERAMELLVREAGGDGARSAQP